MSSFHMDEQDAQKLYTFTGEQLAQLLSDTVEVFVVYLATEPATVAMAYAINEMMIKVDKDDQANTE